MSLGAERADASGAGRSHVHGALALECQPRAGCLALAERSQGSPTTPTYER